MVSNTELFSLVCKKSKYILFLFTVPSALASLDFSRIHVPGSGPSTPNRNTNTMSGSGNSQQQAPPLSVGQQDDPAMIRDMLLANPDQLALLQQNNPTLADAVLSGSLGNRV